MSASSGFDRRQYLRMFEPKLFTVLREGYSLATLRKDAVAGLTVAIVALPLAMALAIASGTTPEKGLHTAIIAGFLISFLGGSKVQIGGPTAAFIPVVFAIIQKFGYGGLILCTLLAGLMLIAAGAQLDLATRKGDPPGWVKPNSQAGYGFGIGIIRPDGSGERLITQSVLDEAPSWAPNGRRLVFARGKSGSRLYTIDVSGYDERQLSTSTAAASPDWSRLLP